MLKRFCLILPICLGLVLITSGCIDIHRNVSRTESGKYVDDRAFARITAGKTTAAWASSLIGEPSSKKKTDAGTEIWTWSYTQSKDVDGQFLIISDKSTTTTHRTASIEVKDGIVVDKWISSRDIADREQGGL